MGESISAATPKAGMREWIGLVVIALPCLLYSMDLTVLHLAVPRLTVALAPSSVQLLWIIDIRSEEHTSELQSRENLVCRLLLEKKNGRCSARSGAWRRQPSR